MRSRVRHVLDLYLRVGSTRALVEVGADDTTERGSSASACSTTANRSMATDARYEDLGGDYFQRRRDPTRETQRLIRQLGELGYPVTLDPVAA